MGQEPVLFNMSIYENIRLGKLDATAAEVEAAAKEAHAYEFISSMSEKGFSTEVGVKGSKLSGGQKQRIAIARAIIKKNHKYSCWMRLLPHSITLVRK